MFTTEQRRVFGPYYDGAEYVFADPLAVYRKLSHRLDGDPNKVLQDTHSEDVETKYAAKAKLLPAAREALEMLPYDKKSGEGALDEDIWAALSAYLEYMEAKKSKGPTSPMYSPPVQGPAPVYAQLRTTAPLSPYGVTSGDCGCKKRGQ